MRLETFEMERMQSTWENLVDYDMSESGVRPLTLRELVEMGDLTANSLLSIIDEILDFATSREDFVYFDPPYYPISATSNFTAYNRDNFPESEQLKLRDIFAELPERGVKVMLSNSNCDFIHKIYSDSHAFPINSLPKLIEISASRGINSDSGKRGKVKELLICSFSINT